MNGIEKVRFADRIGTGHAGEGPEIDVHIHQIFEAGDFKACEHSASPSRHLQFGQLV